jgi:stage III sporulation protein SpoIIIAA
VPNSVLFLGRPGVGKTTVVREMARVLADDLHKRVVIVDTSNEIGGDGDVRPWLRAGALALRGSRSPACERRRRRPAPAAR